MEDLEKFKNDTMAMAIAKYGNQSQMNVAIEEMSELTKELCKHNRGDDNVYQIAEEIADVEIMLEQMRMIFRCDALVESFKVSKLCRLRKRMEEQNGQK